MKKNCVVTIVSGNYLAYARVLAASLHASHSDFDFRVLIVDRKTSLLEKTVRELFFEATFAEDLGLFDAERIFYKYDIVELNTSLKPTFLKQTFALGYEHVIYLDPDIRVFSPLTPVLDALKDNDIILTPHTLAPTIDGLRPSDVDFLRTGAYNLGFIGLKRSLQVSAMLDWWESRCLGLGFNDTSFGIFVDQKWIDLVPCYFSSVGILRHPGCNVAYWNLHERQIEANESGRLTVSGYDLIFFHFSGIMPNNPNILSKHQTRHKLTSNSDLGNLVRSYCKLLLDHDHRKYAEIPYGFGSLDDGRLITQTMRRALLVVPYDESQPFMASSKFQQKLLSVGLTSRRGASLAKPLNTITFDANDSKVRLLNHILRIARYFIGLDRLIALLRYAALLTRESHLPAVLLKQPLKLMHKLSR